MIGDLLDFYARFASVLIPVFGDLDTNIQALIYGYAMTGVTLYEELQYVKKQMRVQTATDDNLDLISKTFFGDDFPRRAGQGDESYRKMIMALLYALRATRPALSRAIEIITGYTPRMFEFWNPEDAAVYNDNNTAYGDSSYGGSIGQWAYYGLIDVYVGGGNASGMAGYGIYSDNEFAYGSPLNSFYASQSFINDIVTDEDILKVINEFKTYGTIVLVNIHRNVPPQAQILTDSFGNVLTDSFGNILYG